MATGYTVLFLLFLFQNLEVAHFGSNQDNFFLLRIAPNPRPIDLATLPRRNHTACLLLGAVLKTSAREHLLPSGRDLNRRQSPNLYFVCGRVDCTLPLLLLLRFRGRREQNRRAAMRPAALLYGNHTTSRRCRGPRACGATRTTRLGSANHWNPRAGGVPEPRHPHGDTPSRGACHSHPAVLHCTWTSRRGRNNPPADAAARSVSSFQLPSTLPPPHSAHPVTLPMPPRYSSPRQPPKPLARSQAPFHPHPAAEATRAAAYTSR